MNKGKKHLCIILTLLVFILLSSICLASSESESPVERISAAGVRIINAILWIGYAVAIGMVIFIGIKYITGAADAKANMKDGIVKWLIGAAIVFSATAIVDVVLNVIDVKPEDDSGGMAHSIVNGLKNDD